jgi:hypothetical protein
MPESIKTILNDVLSQSGFLQRSSFTNSADPDDIQMVSIANRVAYEIMNFYNWSTMIKEHTVNMNAGSGKGIIPLTLYDLPPDFQNMIPDSAWQSEGNRPVEFPVPQARWYMYKHSAYSDGGTYRVRIVGDQLEVHDPEIGESFVFNYISNTPVTDSVDAPKPKFTTDTDLFILDDYILMLGVQAHWMQTKLMPQYQEHYQNYIAKTREAVGRDVGGRIIGGAEKPGSWLNRAPYYPLYRP